MPRVKSPFPISANLADVLRELGDVPVERIRMNPLPGTATERDVISILDRENRLCELVDGVLVEKPIGLRESCLAGLLIRELGNHTQEYDSGIVSAPDGTLRLAPRLVRIPDVAFIPWELLPSREYPDEPIPDLVPALAVEILSESNTPGEMRRKLKEYFLAGVILVWIVDPDRRTVDVYTAPDQRTRLAESDTLDGDPVLPGFRLPLKQLFARVSKKRLGRRGKGKTRRSGGV